MSETAAPIRVCIVGSGNWGSAIAKIVGRNVVKKDRFDNQVNMYVYEEQVNGRKLTEIINSDHENVKYLPGHKLPDNVVAMPDVIEAAKDADILVFVVPHQFVKGLCQKLKGTVRPTAMAVSLIKGLDVKEGGGLQLISDVIKNNLEIECNVLMGANLAPEVAAENYCEATIGSLDLSHGMLLKDLLQTDYFRLVVVQDCETVELCGALKEVVGMAADLINCVGLKLGEPKKPETALKESSEISKRVVKNVVAVGAGVTDGLGYGDNTKAAVIRLGLMEMVKFIEVFYPGAKMATFLESCGVADLVTTCYGGRNRRIAEAFVKTGKPIGVLEQEMLNGQSLQGPPTAAEVNFMLKSRDMEDRFPLFTAIHRICVGELPPTEFISCLENHPEHM